jgi:hypothetical protein
MIRRIVLFKKKTEAGQEDFAKALEGLAELDESVHGASMWWVSVNPGNEDLWHAALVADFESADKLSSYNSHPDHVAVGGQIAKFSDFAVFDSTES